MMASMTKAQVGRDEVRSRYALSQVRLIALFRAGMLRRPIPLVLFVNRVS